MPNSLKDCDDMVELDVVRRGFLHIKRPPTNRKIRLKTWQRRYFILRESATSSSSEDISGAKLEIYTYEPGRDGQSEIAAYVVNLNQVTHVQEYTESRSFPHAFVVIRARKSPLTFGAHTSQEMREWYVAIKLLAERRHHHQPPTVAPRSGPPSPGRLSPRLGHSNRTTPSPDVRHRCWDSPNSSERESPLADPPSRPSNKVYRQIHGHRVRVRSTPDAARNRLSGEYVMAVEDGVVTLRRPRPTASGGGGGGQRHVSWPLTDLRKFKNDELAREHLITIEASGCCGRLQGTYLFRIDCGRELIREVREHVSKQPEMDAQRFTGDHLDTHVPNQNHGGRTPSDSNRGDDTSEGVASYLTVIPLESSPPPPIPVRGRDPSPKSSDGRGRWNPVKDPSSANDSPQLPARSLKSREASSLTPPPSRRRQRHDFALKTNQNDSLSVPDVSVAGITPGLHAKDSISSSGTSISSKLLDLSVEVPAPVRQPNGGLSVKSTVTHAAMERQHSVDLDTFFVLPHDDDEDDDEDDDDDSPPGMRPVITARKSSPVNQSLNGSAGDLPGAARDSDEGYIDLSGSCSDMSAACCRPAEDQCEYVSPSDRLAPAEDGLDYVVSAPDSDGNSLSSATNLEYFIRASDSEEEITGNPHNSSTPASGKDKQGETGRCSDEEPSDASAKQPTTMSSKDATITSDGFRVTSSCDEASHTTCIVSTAFTVTDNTVLPGPLLPLSSGGKGTTSPPAEDAPPPPLPVKNRSPNTEHRRPSRTPPPVHPTPVTHPQTEDQERKISIQSIGRPTDASYQVRVDRPPTASFAVVDVSVVEVTHPSRAHQSSSIEAVTSDKLTNDSVSVNVTVLQRQQATGGSSQHASTRVNAADAERLSLGMTAAGLFGMNVDDQMISAYTAIEEEEDGKGQVVLLPKRLSLQEFENHADSLVADVPLPIAVHSLGRKTGKIRSLANAIHQKRHFVDKDVELSKVVEAQWSAFQAPTVPDSADTEVMSPPPPPLPPRHKSKGTVSQPVVRVQCTIVTPTDGD